MSIRFHFDLADLKNAGGVMGKSPNNLSQHIRLSDIEINVSDQGHTYLDWSGDLPLTESPPKLDPKLVKNITYYASFRVVATRRTGEYVYRSATAILDHDHFSKEERYSLHVAGTDLNDMRQLYRDVREGCIWPVVDYEGEMVPPPARHLRQLLAEGWAIIRRDLNERFRNAKA